MRNVLFSVWKYLSFALCVWFLPLEQWIHATGLPEAAQNSLVLMLCHFHRALQDLCTYGYMCVTCACACQGEAIQIPVLSLFSQFQPQSRGQNRPREIMVEEILVCLL